MTDRTPPPADAPDDSLLHTDSSRWEELVQAVGPAAMQVVIASSMSKALRDHCSPEDIWQETLTHAWRDRAQHRWTGPAAFRAWLFEIARNRILESARSLATEMRGAGRRTTRFSEFAASSTTSLSAAAGMPADSTTPSRIVSKEETLAATREALSTLPPELRDVVRMHLLEELTMEAIAQHLGIGLSAAWHRFRRGSEMLARILPP